MATWECRECTAAYAPDAPACPQCGTNDPIKEAEQLQRENEMAKVSVHNGPSDARTGEGMPEPDGATTGEHVESADGEADPVAEARALYEAMTVEDLKTELRNRDSGLSVTGTKPELVDRLLTDDAARAAETEDAEAEDDTE
ncbi:hypothetical protein DMC63_01300 [Streptomyces sp. WAC 05977]|nr:hypothetical protein DMC63_01300 [Streptomyces sp. WAC 05977]